MLQKPRKAGVKLEIPNAKFMLRSIKLYLVLNYVTNWDLEGDSLTMTLDSTH